MILLELEEQITRMMQPVLYPTSMNIQAIVYPLAIFQNSTTPVNKQLAWDNVSGATGIEVTAGSITIAASNEDISLNAVSLSKEGNHYILSFPQPVHLVSLALQDFKVTLLGSTAPTTFIASANSRLLISIPNEQTQWLPLYCLPKLSKASTPSLYTGIRYSRQSIIFPADMQVVQKIRLSVVDNFTKDNETILNCTLAQVSARIKNLPQDLKLSNNNNDSTLFEHQGLLQKNSPNINIDLVNPAQLALDQQLAAQQPLAFSYTLHAQANTAFQYSASPIKGAIVRHFKATSSNNLTGVAQTLALDLSSAELDKQQASTVTTDLTITYANLRLLEQLNDPVPQQQGNAHGKIVTDTAVTRLLLDPEIASYAIDRIGLIGRAPEACELSLSLTPELEPDKPLTNPAVVQVAPATEIQVIWLSLPQAVSYDGALNLSVRANSGRFLWLATPELAIKVVVQDPDPAGREILINQRLLTTLEQSKLHLVQTAIQPELFVESAPVLSSLLFVTIEFSDLTLRYAR